MINVIVELSKYIILTLMIIYTFHCFYTVRQPDEEERNELLRQQLLLIFFIDFTAFLVIYLKTFNFQVVEFYAEMLLFFAAIQILYRLFYKKASILLLNNMCMLLSVGFIMLCRLDISAAHKQLLIAAGASGIALIIPVMIRKMRFLRKLTWVYAGIGIVLLGAVFALARTSYGAKLSLNFPQILHKPHLYLILKQYSIMDNVRKVEDTIRWKQTGSLYEPGIILA